jgi:hypothetical protein
MSGTNIITGITKRGWSVWGGKLKEAQIREWLGNFNDDNERIHAMYLLSRFMYFGETQMRAILKALYRDLFRYPIIENIRKLNNNTCDHALINSLFLDELKKTRFLGLGNPSESGAHLLYLFRQENELPKHLFIHEYEIIKRVAPTWNDVLKNEDVLRYVFIDDFCGSGSQAIKYSNTRRMHTIKNLNSNIQFYYFSLFSTIEAKKEIIKKTPFDRVECVLELDSSYRCFDKHSRYRENLEEFIDMDYAHGFCHKHGKELMKIICEEEGADQSELDMCADYNALGFRDGQLLLGFYHNVPDNTLPIIWFNHKRKHWIPIIKRYNKVYK